MNNNPDYTGTTSTQNSTGINPDDREQLLLDELRVEVARLADAVERQNELLDETGSEVNLE